MKLGRTQSNKDAFYLQVVCEIFLCCLLHRFNEVGLFFDDQEIQDVNCVVSLGLAVFYRNIDIAQTQQMFQAVAFQSF